MPQRYRLLVIYEDSARVRKTVKIDLDGEPIGEVGEESLVTANTEFGLHTLDLSTVWGKEKTVKFSIAKEQYITRAFIRTDSRNKLEVRIDAGESAQVAAMMVEDSAPTPPPAAVPPPPASSRTPQTPRPARAAARTRTSRPRRPAAEPQRSLFLPGFVGFLLGIICTCAVFLLISPVRPVLSSTPTPSPTAAAPAVALPAYLPESARSVGALGPFQAAIRSAVRTSDETGASVIVITYQWTNESGVAVSAAEALLEQASQAGEDLLPAAGEVPEYDAGLRLQSAAPGETLEVQTAYLLREGGGVVRFSLAETLGDGEELAMEFDLLGARPQSRPPQ